MLHLKISIFVLKTQTLFHAFKRFDCSYRPGGIALINWILEVCAKLIKCNDLKRKEIIMCFFFFFYFDLIDFTNSVILFMKMLQFTFKVLDVSICTAHSLFPHTFTAKASTHM